MEHSSPPETNIEALKKEWDDLYKYPFPPIPEDEYLNELFAELALTDTFNAGIVSSFLKGKKVDRMLITIDTELNEKLSSYQPQSKEAKKILQSMKERKAKLDKMISLVLFLYDKS